MGFEPTTPTLARLCSTPELHPHSKTAATASLRYDAKFPAFQVSFDANEIFYPLLAHAVRLRVYGLGALPRAASRTRRV
jgi:hypothetical protein